MINQLLNRDFVMNQLKQVQKYLALPEEEKRRGGRLPAEARTVGEDDLIYTLEQVQGSLAKEISEASGQSETFGRRGSEPPLDDWSFFSHDPVISNLQTVLDYYLTDGPGAAELVMAPVPDSERRGPGGLALTGNASVEGYEPQQAGDRRVFNKFSVTDPEWVSSALAAGLRLFRRKHDFVTDAPLVPIDDKARIVMVGDWGTGIPRAQGVAISMRKYIDEARSANREVHVIHLGDVYYSGWRREYEKRFLPYWPVKPGEAGRIRSWCLNGNHDMYSGGYGYFDFLLNENKEPRFAAQGGASFFCLENKNWKIFGLDSSWEDGGLREPQAEWVQSRLDTRKKTMLLTHHQPFSSYEKPARKMADKLDPILKAPGGIKAWFWGHEHRFMLFEKYNNVDFGRLVGHGGVPVYMTHAQGDAYPPPGIFEDRKFINRLGGLEHWAYFGFAVLDFDDDKVQVQYIDEVGNPSHAPEMIV